MEEVAVGGLSVLGLDWKALLFQIVNFAVLLWLLKRFAYKPVVHILEARRQKIAESLRTADAIAAEKASLDQERTQRLKQVEAEVSALAAAGQQEAKSIIQAAHERARREAEHIHEQTASHIAGQQRALRAEVKAEALHLIKQAAERVLRQKLDAPADAKLIEQALREVS